MITDGLSNWLNIAPPSVLLPTNNEVVNSALGLTLGVGVFVSSNDVWTTTTYEVRTAANGGGTLVYTTTSPLVPALTLTAGQTYYIRAKYTGLSGYISPYSSDVIITT